MPQNIECVRVIVDLSNKNQCLEKLLRKEVTVPEGDDGRTLSMALQEGPGARTLGKQAFEWLKDANAVHLSAMFHEPSLALFIKLYPDLKNDATKQTKFSPLHIASMKDNAVSTRYELEV